MKSIVPGGGGEYERQELAQKVKASSSMETLVDMMHAFQELGGAQLAGYQRQWTAGTHGMRGNFDDAMQLDATARRLLHTEIGRELSAENQLATYQNPTEVQAAIKKGELKPYPGSNIAYFLAPGNPPQIRQAIIQ